MAKVIFNEGGPGGYSGSMNRKAGGVTFQKNNIVRARNGSPSQPLTAAQARVKNLTTVSSQSWGTTLSTSDREAWNTAAASGDWDFMNPLTGTSRKLSGFALFCSLNANAAFAAQNSVVSISTVPAKAPAGTSFITNAVLTDTGTLTMTYTGTLADDEVHVFSFSAPQGAGRTAFRSSLLSFLVSNATASPVSAGSAYVAKFGALTEATGKNVFYEVKAINTVTGQTRVAGRGTIVITAA